MDLTRTFTIVLEHEPEGGFTVRVPALPEIVSDGNDEQDALEKAKDAILLVLMNDRLPALTGFTVAEFLALL